MDPIVVTIAIALFAASLTWAITQMGESRQDTLTRLETIASLAKATPTEEAAPIEAPLSKAVMDAVNPKQRKLFSFGGGSYNEKLAYSLERAGLKMKPGEFLMLRVAAALVPAAAAVVFKLLWLAPIVALVGFFLPRIWVNGRRQKRITQIDNQLVEALQLLSNALKAGFGMMQAIDSVANQIGGPLGEEFRQLQRDTALGLPPDEALNAMSKRAESYDLDIVVTAIQIQRTVGGNLSEILDQVAETMRERERIKGEIKALTSQQRMTGYIIAALPVFIGGLFYLINADYMNPLVNTLGGRALLITAGFMEVVGMTIIKKIVKIDV